LFSVAFAPARLHFAFGCAMMRFRPTCLLVLTFGLLMLGCRSPLSVYRSPADIDLVLGGGPDWLGVSGYQVRGTNYGISLPVTRLAGTPSWVMKEGKNPPLLPGKATSLARRAFAAEFPDSGSWNIESLSIEAYPETAQNPTSALCNKRYYVISFAPPGDKFFSGDHYPIWVLMDGTVVLPRAEGQAHPYE
jgi:hypothetical protein